MDKAAIKEELHRCYNYLREHEQKLPDHLKETEPSILSTKEQVKLLEKKLAKIEADEEKARKEEQRKIEKSLKHLTEVKDILYKTRQKLEEKWPELHHSHRALASEFMRAISQQLRGYTPKEK